jgi:hypothetical protein
MDLGYQSAGNYVDKSRAVYWNGRNSDGEEAASGVYFYTIRAGDFVSTRKMVVKR